MQKIFLLFLALLVYFISTQETSIIIDNFSVSQADIYRTLGNSFIIPQIDSTVFGGIRLLSSSGSSPGTETTISVGKGQLYYTTTGHDNSLELEYQTITPLDASNALGFQIFLSNAQPIQSIIISIRTSQGYTQKEIDNFPAKQVGTIIQIPFSSFSDIILCCTNTLQTTLVTPDFSSINSISLQLRVTSGGYFILKNIGFYDVPFSGTAPSNSIFNGAISVLPTETLSFDNTFSPNNAILAQCSDLSHASSFLWYKIEATNTVRTISVDTCNTPFDTVIAVFSGTSENDLQLVSCNDDSSNLGSGCNPTSSYITDIYIEDGETIYVVVGGYIDTITELSDIGDGFITFTLLHSDEVACDLDSLVQQREIVVNAINTCCQNTATLIGEFETSIKVFITESDSDLSDLMLLTSDKVVEVKEVVDAIDTLVETISSTLNTTSDNVDLILASINTLTTSVETLGENIDNSFDSTNSLLVILQGTSNTIQSGVGSLQSTSIPALQSSVNGISGQITDFSSSTSTSFGTLSDKVIAVNDAVDSVSSQLTDSTNSIQTDISNIKSDTFQTVFTQTYINYLSHDSVATAPLNIRMPNAYGGKMDDIAAAVVTLYNGLKANALAIGLKDSDECNDSGFCQYFLGTGVRAYLDEMNKYNANLANKKFKAAYTNLQIAYSSLYPSTW